MQKVQFLQDFQGKETREIFYKQGQIVDFDDGMAERLIADGRAALVVINVGNRFDVEPQFEQAEEPPQPVQEAVKPRGRVRK